MSTLAHRAGALENRSAFLKGAKVGIFPKTRITVGGLEVLDGFTALCLRWDNLSYLVFLPKWRLLFELCSSTRCETDDAYS